MTYVAMPFQIKEITNSYLWVGAVGIVETIPLIVFGLYGGVLADAFNRKKLIWISEFAAMIVSILLSATPGSEWVCEILRSAGFSTSKENHNPAESAVIVIGEAEPLAE